MLRKMILILYMKILKILRLTQEKIQQTFAFANYLAKVKNGANVKKGVNEIMNLRNQIPERFRSFVDPGLKQVFQQNK